jgi:hypothetical protein
MLMLENGNEFHPAGNFTEKQLREGLAQPDLLPDFLREFIEDNIRNREKKSEKTLLNEATTYFVDWCKSIKNPLLKRWMHFENNLKNLLIWLNSHKFDLDPTKELVGNHFEADYLRQTEKDQIDLKAWEYHFRDVLTHYDNSNIAVREFIIDEMRWHYLNELEESYIFGIERLLCFAIRLQLINRNIAATEEDGGEKINQLLTEIRAAYVMPEDF